MWIYMSPENYGELRDSSRLGSLNGTLRRVLVSYLESTIYGVPMVQFNFFKYLMDHSHDLYIYYTCQMEFTVIDVEHLLF